MKSQNDSSFLLVADAVRRSVLAFGDLRTVHRLLAGVRRVRMVALVVLQRSVLDSNGWQKEMGVEFAQAFALERTRVLAKSTLGKGCMKYNEAATYYLFKNFEAYSMISASFSLNDFGDKRAR